MTACKCIAVRGMIVGLALAVLGAGAATATERQRLPAGSYEIAQVSDPRVFTLEEQVRQLNGRIEELTFQLLEMQEQMRRMQEDNEFRFQELENPGRGGSAPADDAAQAAPMPPAAAPALAPTHGAASGAAVAEGSSERGAPPRNLGKLIVDGDGNVVGGEMDFSQEAIGSALDNDSVASVIRTNDPEAFYREGYQHVLAGDYANAEGVFRSFIEQFPSDPLAPDARFWLGESVSGQGRLEEAVEIFIAVQSDFPQMQKAPETLLKIGQIMAALGNRDVACVTFDDAVTSYPTMSQSVQMRIREERTKAKC
ncbi:tol-pal system protein YbgF [Oricola sp.]|uniref:tol-pal system protein YbgF n=1 Tax=Oricola sp. TaxID=1979950 RepID=UPI003BAB47CB